MNRKLQTLVLILLLLSGSSLTRAQSAPASAPKSDISDLGPPEHPATPDQIREYFVLTHSIETAHKAMAASLKMARATSAPYYSQSFWDDMETAVMQIDMVSPSIPAYQKYFSQEDMAATIAFYKSAAGQRLLAAQPYITAAASDVLRKAGEAVGAEVGLKHKDEIERLMKQAQPPQPSSSPVK